MGYIYENISGTVKMAAAEWSIEGIRYLREKEIEREWEGRNVGRESTVRTGRGLERTGQKTVDGMMGNDRVRGLRQRGT